MSSDAERVTAFRELMNALLDLRQRGPEAEQPASQGEGLLRGLALPEGTISDGDVGRALTALLGPRGSIYLDDDENDEDYQPSEGEEDEGDEDQDEDEAALDVEEDEEEVFGYGWSRPTEPHGKWFEDVKEPKQEGLSLLFSGEFGRIKHQVKSRNKDANVAKLLLRRTTKLRPTPREDFTASIIPNTDGTSVASYTSNAYVGQFSSDSSFYYTCVRDFRLHVYDANAPITPIVPRAPQARMRNPLNDDEHQTSMKVIKTIRAMAGGWTITDSHLSPDNQRIIYASVCNLVFMASTLDASPQQTAINFADPVRQNSRYGYGDLFGVWSCKFSADGNEVIAGGTEMVFVYDLLADKRTVKIKAHEDDINSCCWADTASGNVLVSASDDTFLKVWDRRSLGSSPKPSGILMGHTEGITYVSAKGDGRYVISNGKDQVCRLWDLRKMRNNLEFESEKDRHYGIPNFDYRRGVYPKPRNKAHPLDCSVMQYTGHEVLRTLIRCHFSPDETTGGQYIYSGGADGKIHIWSLDGRVVQVLDRSNTLPMSYDPAGPQPGSVSHANRKVCVRDVSWHSQQPVMMSAGWLGTGWSSYESSVIARHEWKGLSKMSYNLPDYVEKERAEASERFPVRLQRAPGRAMPGAFMSDLLDD